MATRSRPLIGLRSWRKKRGYTQEQLADLIGYSPRSIQRWEEGHGYPGRTAIKALCQHTGLTREQLASAEADAVLPIKKDEEIHSSSQEHHPPSHKTLLMMGTSLLFVLLVVLFLLAQHGR